MCIVWLWNGLEPNKKWKQKLFLKQCRVFKPSECWWQSCRDKLTTLQSRVTEFIQRTDDRTSHRAHCEIVTRSVGWKWFYFYTPRFIGVQSGLACSANNCAWHFFLLFWNWASVCRCVLHPAVEPPLLHSSPAGLTDWWQYVCFLQCTQHITGTRTC